MSGQSRVFTREERVRLNRANYESHFARKPKPYASFLGRGGLWMLLDDDAPKYERAAFVKAFHEDPHAWGSVTELMRFRCDDEAWRVGAEVNLGRGAA